MNVFQSNQTGQEKQAPQKPPASCLEYSICRLTADHRCATKLPGESLPDGRDLTEVCGTPTGESFLSPGLGPGSEEQAQCQNDQSEKQITAT